MKILVIIVTYNAMQWAERCFNSLMRSTIRSDVFVVDNGSTDGTQAYIREYYPEVIFFQNEVNLGFGKANNIGLQYLIDNDYDYAYLLNQDAWVMPETFERLIGLSKKYQEYGILSPFQMNADLFHIDLNFISNVLEWKSNPDIVNDLYNSRVSEVYPVSCVMAAHWLMTRECLLKVGGFSPTFPHYAEDDNYADRVHLKGLKIGIVPSLRVVHDRGWRENSKKKIMHLAYTQFLRIISDPSKNPLKQYLKAVKQLLKSIRYYGSIVPLINACLITIHLYRIINNRKISIKNDCAFLEKRFS